MRSAQAQPGYIQLTRFAAQQLYAPTRLVKERPGIVRVPVTRDPVELLHGGTIEATPLGGVAGQWTVCHGRQAHQPHRAGRRPWIRVTCGVPG